MILLISNFHKNLTQLGYNLGNKYFSISVLCRKFYMMEVITIETQAYKDLMAKINAIAKFVIASQTKETEETNDSWIDSYEVCTFLKISSRTLQRLRAARQINYSQIRGKNFYKISEIQRLLNEHVIRSSDNCLQDLVKNHKLYVEQRRDIKKNK
jgi:hypothetical protein